MALDPHSPAEVSACPPRTGEGDRRRRRWWWGVTLSVEHSTSGDSLRHAAGAARHLPLQGRIVQQVGTADIASPRGYPYARPQGALLIDVRDEDELLRNPPLGGALHLSRGRLEYLITDAVNGKDDPLVVYCAGGNRGALAALSLQSLGYTQVYNVRGGLHAWRDDSGQAWFAPGWGTGNGFEASLGTA